MARAEPRIVALGGASVLPGSTDGPLHQYLLDLTGQSRPRICFLPTASGDDAGSVAAFYGWFARRAEATHLGLFDRRVEDIAGFLEAQDVIYVGGGNTANMLAIWRIHGVDVALREAWQSGVVVAGPSAGANCWFEGSVTDSFGPGLGPLSDGLGFLKGSFCPHYDSESARRPRYHEFVASGALPDGYAADDGVGLLFSRSTLVEAVASMPESRAFRLERAGRDATETSIRPRLLRA
ncbi:MAG: peptidase E [Gemmatimonadales bacterium]